MIRTHGFTLVFVLGAVGGFGCGSSDRAESQPERIAFNTLGKFEDWAEEALEAIKAAEQSRTPDALANAERGIRSDETERVDVMVRMTKDMAIASEVQSLAAEVEKFRELRKKRAPFGELKPVLEAMLEKSTALQFKLE